MATSYEEKGGRSKKAIQKRNKAKAAGVSPKKLSLGAAEPFKPILGQDPPIIIKPGSLSIVVGSDPETPHQNRLKEKPVHGHDYEYRHNQASYEVKAVMKYDVDADIETPVDLPDDWEIHIYYLP